MSRTREELLALARDALSTPLEAAPNVLDVLADALEEEGLLTDDSIPEGEPKGYWEPVFLYVSGAALPRASRHADRIDRAFRLRPKRPRDHDLARVVRWARHALGVYERAHRSVRCFYCLQEEFAGESFASWATITVSDKLFFEGPPQQEIGFRRHVCSEHEIHAQSEARQWREDMLFREANSVLVNGFHWFREEVGLTFFHSLLGPIRVSHLHSIGMKEEAFAHSIYAWGASSSPRRSIELKLVLAEESIQEEMFNRGGWLYAELILRSRAFRILQPTLVAVEHIDRGFVEFSFNGLSYSRPPP